MFIGHLAVGFASKRVAPQASLGVLMAAPTALDLLWPIFLTLGWETVRIDPGNTAFTPLDPYSHSLLMSALWGLVFGGIYWAVTRHSTGAIVIGLGILSHWIFDAVTHRADLPLDPGSATRFGLGLWNSIPATLVVESLMFAAAVWLYGSVTRARDRVGRYSFSMFVAVAFASYLSNAFGPPPPRAEFLARFGFGLWLFPLWAGWFDAHRTVTTRAPA